MSSPALGSPAKPNSASHPLDSAWEIVQREFAAACSQSADDARKHLLQNLNQSLRRLQQYRTEAEWVPAVLDGASEFANELALFAVETSNLRLRGQRNLTLADDLTFAVASAGAFATALEAKDSVVALRTAKEVTEPLSSPDTSARAHIVPIRNGSRIAALLFAAGNGSVDVNGLELIAAMASAVLERQSNLALHAQIAPAIAPAPPPSQAATQPSDSEDKPQQQPATKTRPPSLPSWADLNEQQRELHIRAQRFSRVAVAEMQLSRPEACRAGREQRNLYVFLKKEIDKAREAYRKQFITIPSMVDYLHLELVRTAAEGDELKLGADYPGQLV